MDGNVAIIRHLESENAKLKEQVEYWRNKCLTNQDTLELAETISLGGKIECVVCGKFKPCVCDK